MPFDWNAATVGDFVDLQRGNTYQSALLDKPGPMLLGLGSIDRDGGFRSDKLRTYGGESVDKLLVYPGDMYVSLKDVTQSGDLLGSVARVPSHIAVGRMTQDTVKLIFNREPIDRSYLYWMLRTPEYREYCRARGMGTTNLSLSRDDFLSFPIPKPTPARRHIQRTLDAIERKMSLNRDINQTLEGMAQALFKSWFVDFDPVKAKITAIQQGRDPLRAAMSAISGKSDAELDALPPAQYDPLAATATLFPNEMEESELGEVPRGWSVTRIQDVVEGVYDGPHATPPEATDGAVFLGIRNMTGTSLDMSDVRHIAEADWAQWTRRVEPRAGDIVFSYEATLGHFALLPSGLRCCLGRRLALIRPRTEQGFGSFWFHQFVAPPFQRLLEKHTIPGATVNRIALKDFPSFPVLKPTAAAQSAFCRHADSIWSLIHSNQAQSERLARLRDTLLPKLLSGELPVEALVEPAGAA